MNKRIQRKRTKGWRMPLNTVYVGRGSKYGNPYKVLNWHSGYRVKNEFNGSLSKAIYSTEEEATARACHLYEFYLRRKYQGAALYEFIAPLKGKDLACWCALDKQCHADVLLRMVGDS